MELFKFNSTVKAIFYYYYYYYLFFFFCLSKLPFIKVRCLINVNFIALRLILKVKGGKQHCLPFVGSNLEVEIFLKKREHQERMH